MTTNYQDLGDSEVLTLCGNAGPTIVGAYIHERAEWIRRNNPEGRYGPTIANDGPEGPYVPSDAAMADLVSLGMDRTKTVSTPAKRGRPRKVKP